MTNANLEKATTAELVDELRKRAGVEYANLIKDMHSSVSTVGPVEVLIVKPDQPVE